MRTTVVALAAAPAAAAAAAARSWRPARAPLARPAAPRRCPTPGRSGAVVVQAAEGQPMYTNGVLLAAAMLGLTRPADFAFSSGTLGVVMAGGAAVAGLELNLKDVKSTALTMLGVAATAVAAPLLAQAALTQAAPAADLAALAACTAKMVLAPLLAGATINTVLPQLTWKARGLLPFLTLPLAFVVCSNVAARGAVAAQGSGLRMAAAILAVQAGATLLALAATKLLGAPKPGGAVPTGLLAGAALSAAHFSADPLIGVACVCAAVLSSAVSSLAGGSSALRAAGDGEPTPPSWQAGANTYINTWCERQGLSVPAAKAGAAAPASGQGLPAETYIRRYMDGTAVAAAAPAVPANVASARAWIGAWRAKQA